MKLKLLFLISVLILVHIPCSIFGQFLNLGAASDFALFTSAGEFSNIGESNITGNIGTNAGGVSGFPPGTLTGQIEVENAISSQVAADVNSAYNSLSAIPCDSAIGGTLGNDQILTSGTYCIGVASTLSGDLFLDGENDPDALFIVKINGTLKADTLSKVILINSTSHCNVYWQVTGALTIDSNAVFQGTMLIDGAVSLMEGSSLYGSALSRAGAISTFGVTSTESCTGIFLPINLLFFKGSSMQSHNLIAWSTASETNNNYFTLEKTSDGKHFTEIAKINGKGTSSSQNSYTYTDYNLEKKVNYYRLMQTDYDGKAQTFELITIDNTAENHKVYKTINMMGQEVKPDYQGFRIIYYQNGRVEKKHIFDQLNTH